MRPLVKRKLTATSGAQLPDWKSSTPSQSSSQLDERVFQESVWFVDKLTRVNDQDLLDGCSIDMVRSSSPDIDIISCSVAGTIPGLMLRRAERLPNAVAYSEFGKGGAWRDVTWQEMAKTVARYRIALVLAGMVRGDRVAVLLANCIDWIAFDIAAMANGLITVPLYLHDSAANIRFILTNSGARLCLIDSTERWNKLAPVIARGGSLTEVWTRSGDQAPDNQHGIDIRRLADVLSDAEGDSGPLRCAAQDIATLIYTSGTTGLPKGAMLSHHALLWNAEAVTEFIPPLTSDVFLSLLPLAHAFERTLSYHMAMMGGSRVVFARSIETLRQDLVDVQPTILVAVPRLYERIHETIQNKVTQSAAKRRLVDWAAEIGWQHFEARHGRAKPPAAITRFLVWPLLGRLVAGPVLRAFGGHVRVAISGGAPLPTNVSHFLIGLGLPLVEGYGLTEAAPVVTATTLEDNAPGSVGRLLPGVAARLGHGGELLVKSPSLMQGYWQDPERSAAAIDGDGWLHTGDIAEFRANRVYIVGRLKELIVLSTGKKVVSANIEAAITADPLFEQCCVFGNNRAALVAVVVLGRDCWEAFAKLHHLDLDDPNKPTATAAILTRIMEATHDQPPFAQVRAVHALLQPWTADDGSLTPTLKIKRKVIEDRYQTEIEELYARQAARRRHES